MKKLTLVHKDGRRLKYGNVPNLMWLPIVMMHLRKHHNIIGYIVK